MEKKDKALSYYNERIRPGIGCGERTNSGPKNRLADSFSITEARCEERERFSGNSAKIDRLERERRAAGKGGGEGGEEVKKASLARVWISSILHSTPCRQAGGKLEIVK